MQKTRIGLIYGSTREGRLCESVAEWAAGRIWQRNSFEVDVLDPVTMDLPVRMTSGENAAVANLQKQVGQADAFVVVVPEYNHSYPAPLKAMIDSVNEEWRAKPVGFVSYGGISGGLRAVEHLRLVFAELHAVGIRNSVSFADVWNQFDENGHLKSPLRYNKSMDNMLSQLQWWATALKSAREITPYGRAA